MPSRLEEVGKDLTAGTMAGIAQLLVGHPFDTVKVKLQSQMAGLIPGQTPKYNGALDAVRKILATEGPKGLYRGVGAPLATVALFNAVLFTARGQMEAILLHNKQPYTPLSIPQQMVAGAGAGIAVTFVACPTELVKCRLQAQSSSENDGNVGSLPTSNITVLEQQNDPELGAAQMTTNDGARSNIGLRTMVEPHDIVLIPHENNVDEPPEEEATTTTNLEALESQRHQDVQAPDPQPRSVVANVQKLKGCFAVAEHIFRHEGGMIGFFRGMIPTFLREVFGNAAYFGSYQGMKQLFSRGSHGSPLSMGSLLLAGGVAGAIFWAFVYPADVIKSMIQVDDYQHPKYTGTLDAFRKVFKEQGLRGFYCGFGPAMIRSFVANAVCFLVYELVRRGLK